MTFQDFNLTPTLLKAVDEAGFIEPSPVQKEAIPLILEGKDVIAQAQTGTGKTAAFGLPVMSMMDKKSGVEALVIVPTRELATQVSDELYRFGKSSGIRTATIYGGVSYQKQLERIASAHIVIATPGRLLDLLQSKKITLSPSFVILDEADEMLDMGFLDEIKKIFTFLPSQRQTLMFSATMPPAIRNLAESILVDPKRVSITKKESTNTKIDQRYYVVAEHEKTDALIRLLDFHTPKKSIVFCRTKREVDTLSTYLSAQGFKAGALHGDMEQKQREITIRNFKKDGGVEILVATDVAARGLDVSDVTHVFNYVIPDASESYVHRIGRTGRGGKSGEAITLVTPAQLRTIKRIEREIGTKILTDVIPSRREVQKNKTDALIEKIASVEVRPEAIDLVRTLLHDADIVTIAHLLAALVLNETQVKGKDKIGFDLAQAEAALRRSFEQRPNGSRRSGRQRYARSSQSRRNRSRNYR